MGKKIILDSTLTAIANAIRGKTGKSASMTPLEMPGEITGIPDMNPVLASLLDGTATGVVTLRNIESLSNAQIYLPSSVTELHCPDMADLLGNPSGGVVTGGNSALSVLDIPKCKRLTLNNYVRSTSKRTFENLETINAPELESLSGFIRDTKLTEIILPKCTGICQILYSTLLTHVIVGKFNAFMNSNTFQGCSNLKTIELGSSDTAATDVGFRASAFNSCGVDALVLRHSGVPELMNTSAFNGTPIASGTGYIYVPRSLKSTYEGATNWTTYTGQFRAIEDYTNDGTIDGTFVHP